VSEAASQGPRVATDAFDHAHAEVPLILRPRRDRLRRRAAKRVGNHKPMRFVSLHHHSTYSFVDGIQLPEAHVRRITELNMTALAMTEHGNTMSHVKLEQAAHKAGVQPIFGCEFYTGRVGKDATQRKYHLTVLAKDLTGYRNLIKLVSLSYSEGFYYEPTVSWDMLQRHREGLIVLSGCQGSLLYCSTVGGKLIDPKDASFERAVKVARQFKALFDGNYFIEVQAFPELESSCHANPILAEVARKCGIPLVGTMDVHYTYLEERELQKVLHNVRPGEKRTLEDMAREWGYAAPLCPPHNDLSVYRKLRGTGLSHEQAVQAVISTEEIAQACKGLTLPKLDPVIYPPSNTKEAYLNKTGGVRAVWLAALKDGWAYRGVDKLPRRLREAYITRLRYERGIIEDKNFIEYHLIVSDVVRWAKDHGITVGPGRGSAAASLCCWLLRITEVNPMLFPDLVFDRYIDRNRMDLPDIDLDFDSERRHEIREYLVSKYGEGCVNNVGTFGTYKAKLALDDVARVFQIPKYEVETVKNLLIERSSGDLRASATIEDTVIQFEEARQAVERHPNMITAMDLEGNVKGFGVHAAGLVISNGPITDICATITRKDKQDREITVVSLDKYDAERQGMLKLDLLGLNTMTVLTECLRLTGMTLKSLYSLPLDIPEVLDVFRRNDVVGIFQFEGRALRSVNGSLKAETFNEICDATALARPGPLHNGAANAYIDIKRGLKRPERIHPALDRITGHTNYQIVYQEQILRIVREIGGFDWTASAYIRKIISRKIGEQEFQRQFGKFQAGARKLHKREPDMPAMSDDQIKTIWGDCITSGSYAFNAAHSRSYGYISYFTAYFKALYPAVFYAASLNKGSKGSGTASGGVKIDRKQTLLQDAAKHDIKVLPPSLQSSELGWSVVDDHVLQAGFEQIKGFANKRAQALLDARESGVRLDTWDDLIRIPGIGAKTVAAIKEFVQDSDPFKILWLGKVLEQVRRELPALKLPEPTHTAAEVPYESGPDTECIWMGVVVHLNLRDIFETNRSRTGEELDRASVKNPELNEFLLAYGYDGSDYVNLRFNRWVYPKFKDALWNIRKGEDIVLIRGVKPGWRTARELFVNSMWVIEP
jgi:Zierdtviridae DNA polymerase